MLGGLPVRKAHGRRRHVAGARTPAPTEPAPDGSSLGPLTAREREVADLVSEGLSNRQIAERLVISKRTVDADVERILAKLGFKSRTQVTALVRTHKPEPA